MITLDLPISPTINHAYGVARNGRKFIRPAGVAFRQAVCEIVAERQLPMITGRVSVFIAVHMPTKRRADIDNRVKAALDALTHAGVFLDDSQVDSLHLVRRGVVKGGKMTVVISEIKDD
jgi:crossover junction endodeoxyribonuclease RusA